MSYIGILVGTELIYLLYCLIYKNCIKTESAIYKEV